jgi:AcrR family transcriptional regulator
VTPAKRADARRNEEALLGAAAAVFAESGVAAPVREVASQAGVGVATIYRHFPTRADLVVAVFRHQVEECVEAVPGLLAAGPTPYDALARWLDLFVDFLVTKHGLAEALQSQDEAHATLHAYFVERLVPACTELLDAAVAAGQVAPGVRALDVLRGIGNLSAGDGTFGYDARPMIDALVAGLATGAGAAARG